MPTDDLFPILLIIIIISTLVLIFIIIFVMRLTAKDRERKIYDSLRVGIFLSENKNQANPSFAHLVVEELKARGINLVEDNAHIVIRGQLEIGHGMQKERHPFSMGALLSGRTLPMLSPTLECILRMQVSVEIGPVPITGGNKLQAIIIDGWLNYPEPKDTDCQYQDLAYSMAGLIKEEIELIIAMNREEFVAFFDPRKKLCR